MERPLTPPRAAWTSPALGVVVLTLLGLHAWREKTPGKLAEMLYLCHLSSGTIAVGLILQRIQMVAAGFLTLATLGLPSWMIYSIITRDVTWSSVAVHLVPFAIAARGVYVNRLPPRAGVGAIGLFLVSVALGALASNPRENLNLAFGPGPGMLWLHLGVAPWRALVVVVGSGLLLAVERLVRRYRP